MPWLMNRLSDPRDRSYIGAVSVRNTLPYAVRRAFEVLRAATDTIGGRLLAWWWNIALAPGSRFYGMPVVRKHPTATISIGAGCEFRSAVWSNPVGITRPCLISADRGSAVRIGRDCGFSGAVIASAKHIRIGNRVLCGANCTITDTDHHSLNPAARAEGLLPQPAPVEIGDDVFLGMNVVVLKGVTIGGGTVVAANSIVSKSLPPCVLAGGAPAKPIKSLMNVAV
jgi:acetyltransferase-like isoleucine patch superfamily enzyme